MYPKIIIITQGISRIVAPIVKGYEVVGIIESASRYKKKEKLGITPIRKFLRIILSSSETLKSFSHKSSIPYFYMDKGSSNELEEWIKKKNADIIIIYGMGQLLRENIYNLPKYGTINLHPSLLPDYRGPNPWFWQYYNMDKIGGVTIHFVDEKEDTGDIIFQEKYKITLGMRSPEMHDKAISDVGVKLIQKVLDNLSNLPRIVQPQKSPTIRARNISVKEHKEMIDWDSWGIERIWHLLRGTELWLNAFKQPKGLFKGHRWRIDDYEKCDTNGYSNGIVYKRKGEYFVVCSEGKIKLELNFSLKIFIKRIITDLFGV